MKKRTMLALVSLLVILASCSNGVVGFKPEGEATGLPFSALGLNSGLITFGNVPEGHKDINGVVFPVNKYGLLTCQKNPTNTNEYRAPLKGENPAMLFVNLTPNAGLRDVSTYNLGGFEYEATFRITDPAYTHIVVPTILPKQVDEPQGLIMTVIWVDSLNKPIGSLMLATFIDNAFPCSDTEIPGGLDTDPSLEENVILLMNYHDPNIAHLIGAVKVPTIKAQNPAGSLTGNDKADGFHTAKIRVYPDANYSGTDTTKHHGPSLSVWIDGAEVIHYSNDGAKHYMDKDTWDSKGDAATKGSDITLARDVFEIPDDAHVAYFEGPTRGVSEYNTAWKNLVSKKTTTTTTSSTTTTTQTSNLVTFGVTFQLGGLGDAVDKGKPKKIITNKQYSPEVKNISVKPYPAP